MGEKLQGTTYLIPHRGMFTSGFEEEWHQIYLEESLELGLIVAHTQDAKVDLFDEVELTLLVCHDEGLVGVRCGIHSGANENEKQGGVANSNTAKRRYLNCHHCASVSCLLWCFGGVF